MPKIRPGRIENDANIIRLSLADNFKEHGDKPIYGLGRHSPGIGQPPYRVECPIDIGASVDYEKLFPFAFYLLIHSPPSHVQDLVSDA